MGTPRLFRQLDGARPIVAFDFDGTLTTHDSLTAFLAWTSGVLRYGLGIMSILPSMLTFAGDRDRERLKVAVLRRFLGGMDAASLSSLAEDFAAAHFARLIRPDALAVWRGWQDKGALMVIVTASPELLVAPFARRLGAERLIGTRLAIDTGGRIDGALIGPNCRGPEKVARLEAEFGVGLTLAAAYGDTAGDREMLARTQAPGYRVFKARP